MPDILPRNEMDNTVEVAHIVVIQKISIFQTLRSARTA